MGRFGCWFNEGTLLNWGGRRGADPDCDLTAKNSTPCVRMRMSVGDGHAVDE